MYVVTSYWIHGCLSAKDSCKNGKFLIWLLPLFQVTELNTAGQSIPRLHNICAAKCTTLLEVLITAHISVLQNIPTIYLYFFSEYEGTFITVKFANKYEIRILWHISMHWKRLFQVYNFQTVLNKVYIAVLVILVEIFLSDDYYYY